MSFGLMFRSSIPSAACREAFMANFFKLTATVLTLIAFAISGVASSKADPRDNVVAMLEAINKIRTARDIKLDCAEYVERYLGHSEVINEYIRQFSAAGIQPKRTSSGPSHYIYF